MKKIFSLLLASLTAFLLVLVTSTSISQAREVTEAVGVDANSAVIVDSDGNTISHDAELPEDQQYTVRYTWSIPNSVKMSPGDTMTFQIPDNVRVDHSNTFTMKNPIVGSIGTATITEGSNIGVVTFNSAFSVATISRRGYIYITVNGTVPDTNQSLSPITVNKSGSWVDENNPNTINWQVNVIASGNELVNPVFTDTIGSNQTYVPDSAKLTDALGYEIPYTLSMDNNVMTIQATGNYIGDLNLTYQTTTNSPTGADSFDNQVDYTDDNGNSGSATATVTRPDVTEPEEPGTTEPEEPGTTEPEEPGTSEPEEPGTTEPEEPGTTEPEEPGTTEPEEPGTSEPEQPGTTEPEEPGTTEPEEPGTTEPEEPGTSEPEEPGTSEPEEPGTSEPEEPGTSEPEEPGTSEPEQPGTTEPEQPGTTEPEEPGTSEPEEPGTSEPEQPGTSEPEEPGTSEPEEPGTSEPEEPGTSEPEEPGTSESEKPVITEPAKPETSNSGEAATEGSTNTEPITENSLDILSDEQSGLPVTNNNDQKTMTYLPSNVISSNVAKSSNPAAMNKFPQTGEKENHSALLLGILLLIAGLSFIFIRRYRLK
ncbi:Ig-like domain-containing protein [Companilactobacillus sp. HBUAS59699]|uniref:Ig-like domain-containing protein n=1 Tax=Companilactobacillus sp. HBUAS59699 TaxID=3109358 RepID=UPI002FEEC251